MVLPLLLRSAWLPAAKGDVRLMTTTKSGVRGKSRMMMDRNNLKIADLILAWVDEKADR